VVESVYSAVRTDSFYIYSRLSFVLKWLTDEDVETSNLRKARNHSPHDTASNRRNTNPHIKSSS